MKKKTTRPSKKKVPEKVPETQATTFLSEPVFSEDFKASLKSANSDVDDDLFDRVLPPLYRASSDIHWTQIGVIKTISEYLSDLGKNSKFLDIGSGCGKVCLVMSYLVKFKLYGIEQRKDLYEVAERIRAANKLKQVHFKHANLLDLQDWHKFDAFYLFNPFQEHITDEENMRIDENLDFNKKTYVQYTQKIHDILNSTKKGTRLVTFHGFGGKIPASWKRIKYTVIDDGELSLWKKIK